MWERLPYGRRFAERQEFRRRLKKELFRNRQRELFPLKRQRGLFPLVQGEHPECRHTAVRDKGIKRLRQASTILEILSATRLADRRVALVRPVTPVPAAILDEGV